MLWCVGAGDTIVSSIEANYILAAGGLFYDYGLFNYGIFTFNDCDRQGYGSLG